MRAVLKQKQKNKEGRYGWVQRTFTLKVEKRVLSAEAGGGGAAGGRTRNYSLATAAFARTWGAAMGGSGLDISWQSGHMWSLLAESADVALLWVRELNVAIGFTGEPPSDPEGHPPLLGGETAALARLATVAARGDWVRSFSKPETNPLEWSPGSTTMLSPYLKFGAPRRRDRTRGSRCRVLTTAPTGAGAAMVLLLKPLPHGPCRS